MKQGDSISLMSPVPDAFLGQGQCGDDVGTFQRGGDGKVFGDGEVRIWKRFRNVSRVKSVSFSTLLPLQI